MLKKRRYSAVLVGALLLFQPLTAAYTICCKLPDQQACPSMATDHSDQQADKARSPASDNTNPFADMHTYCDCTLPVALPQAHIIFYSSFLSRPHCRAVIPYADLAPAQETPPPRS